MSAPHITLDSLPSFAENYQSLSKFVEVMTKIILLEFF